MAPVPVSGERVMKHPVRDRLNKRRFLRARAKADRTGEVLCAVATNGGKPVYFTAPRTTPETELEARAFALRYGRSIGRAERLLQSAARSNPIRDRA